MHGYMYINIHVCVFVRVRFKSHNFQVNLQRHRHNKQVGRNTITTAFQTGITAIIHKIEMLDYF